MAEETTEQAPTLVDTPEPPPELPDWKQALPEDMRNSDYVQKHDGLPDLVKEAINAQKLIGRKGIIPPTENATIQDWARYYGQLGRPDSVEGYDLSNIERPEDIQWDESTEKEILQEMYDSGLNPQQVERIMRRYVEVTAQQVGEIRAQSEQAVELAQLSLKREFGAAYEGKLDAARRGFSELLGPAAERVAEQRLADGSRLGDNPDMIRAMSAVGERMSEAGLIGPKQTRFAATPQEASEQIKTLMGDEGFLEAWMSETHPGHADAVSKIEGLYQAAEGRQ